MFKAQVGILLSSRFMILFLYIGPVFINRYLSSSYHNVSSTITLQSGIGLNYTYKA